MSDLAIQVEGLGKQYRLGQRERYKALRDVLANPFKRSPKAETIWALRDVNFTVKQGEVIGVIGRNGAGKSTLLKILSQITEPTKGYAEIHGRVGSLLEVGTGFHPELTGRENIFLNGAILGMRKAEITRKFDEIVAFAEVEKFIDTPVKHYSSGMQMRLAFSVAAHLEPEILLVDEVLAVGDTSFQQKCIGKMGEVSRQGRTVLFVSHSLAAIVSLCGTCILLEDGTITAFGPVQPVVDKYLSAVNQCAVTTNVRSHRNRQGSGEVRVVAAALQNQAGVGATTFQYSDDIRFVLTLEAGREFVDLICVIWIKTATGLPVMHLVSTDDPQCGTIHVNHQTRVICVLPKCKLYPGEYRVSVWVGPGHAHPFDFVVDLLDFRMEQGRLLHRGFDMNWSLGIFHGDTQWSIAPHS